MTAAFKIVRPWASLYGAMTRAQQPSKHSLPMAPPPPPLHLEDLGSPSQPAEWAALVEKQAEFFNQRSTWLRQRLRAASELLSKAEQELEILGE